MGRELTLAIGCFRGAQLQRPLFGDEPGTAVGMSRPRADIRCPDHAGPKLPVWSARRQLLEAPQVAATDLFDLARLVGRLRDGSAGRDDATRAGLLSDGVLAPCVLRGARRLQGALPVQSAGASADATASLREAALHALRCTVCRAGSRR